MNDKATRRAVREAAKLYFATIDKAKIKLGQMGFAYPGGDTCPSDVVRGLASMMMRMTPESSSERLAYVWLELWLTAAADMLPAHLLPSDMPPPPWKGEEATQ